MQINSLCSAVEQFNAHYKITKHLKRKENKKNMELFKN